MEDLFSVVFLYRGTSLSDKCMMELKMNLLNKRGSVFELHGNMCFEVSKVCRCGDNCGGIFCDPLILKSLLGVVDPDTILQDCISGLNIDIVKCSEGKQTKLISEKY